MQRLSTLDASFLRVETPSAHMHVGWLASVRLPDGIGGLDPTALTGRITGRLHLAPRFRQRVMPAPVGEPVWVDHGGFRLDEHVLVAPEPIPDRNAVGELEHAVARERRGAGKRARASAGRPRRSIGSR